MSKKREKARDRFKEQKAVLERGNVKSKDIKTANSRKIKLENKRKTLERNVKISEDKYKKLAPKESALSKAGKYETYVRLERGQYTDKKGNTKYKTRAKIALREKKYQGHGVLHTAVRRLDKFEGDVPSVERRLRNMTPTTRGGRIARNTLLVGTTALKTTGKTALNMGLATEDALVKGTTKIAKKAASTAVQTAKSKLRNKADEALEPYSVYLKAADYMLSPKEIKQYIRQKKSHQLATAKAKLLKNESRLSGTETKIAKEELKQAKRKYSAQKGKFSFSQGNKENVRYSQSYIENSEKLSAGKQELKAAKSKLIDAKSDLRQAKKTDRILKTGNNSKTDKSEINFTKKALGEREKASSEVKKAKKKVRQLKQDKRNIVKGKTNDARFDMRERKAEYRAKLSASHGVLAGKSREYAMQKRLAKYEKPKSLVGSKISKLASSSYHKVMNADPDNHSLQAMGKAVDMGAKLGATAVSTYKLLNKAEIKAASHFRDKSRASSQKKLQNNKYKLQKQKAAAAERYAPPKNHIKPKEKIGKIIKDFFKSTAASAGSAGAAVLTASLPIIIVILSFTSMIFMLMGGLTGGMNASISWISGTYPADDVSLSEALYQYMEIASDLNKRIIVFSDTNNWSKTFGTKSVLKSAYGADTSKMKTRPTTITWGNSSEFPWNPGFDFDREKLWAFLCAYYAEFDDSGNAELGSTWKYTDDTKALLKKLFDSEYTFVYKYEDKGYWEDLRYYEYHPESKDGWFLNDGCSDRYAYSDCFDASSDWRLFSDSCRIYFDPSTFEILDVREKGDSSKSALYGYNGYKRTGYYLVNQYDSNCDRCFYDFYGRCDDGYYDYGHTHSDGRTTVSHGNDYYKYLVAGEDLGWGDGAATWAWQYFKRSEWVNDCAFFFNIKQNQSFDESIRNMLNNMENAEERISLYEMYLGDDGGIPDIHGGHQFLANILPGDSFYEEYVEKGKIVTDYGIGMNAWHEWSSVDKGTKSHMGIDISVANNTEVYAAFDGEICYLNSDDGIIEIENTALNYLYETAESDKDIKYRDTKIRYCNVTVPDTLKNGTKVKAGELIGYTTANKKCDAHTDNSGLFSAPYLHVTIKLDSPGWGWSTINPVLLLGNKKEPDAVTDTDSDAASA